MLLRWGFHLRPSPRHLHSSSVLSESGRCRQGAEPSTSAPAVTTTYSEARAAVRAGLAAWASRPKAPRGASALLEDAVVHKITVLAGYKETTTAECGHNANRLHDSQDDLLLSMEVPPDANVCSLEFDVESHDQGWADSRETSYTWGEIGVVPPEGPLEPSPWLKRRRIIAFVNKAAEYGWQHHRFELSGEELRARLQGGPGLPTLGFYARSVYPGWICFVRRARLTIRWVPASPGGAADAYIGA